MERNLRINRTDGSAVLTVKLSEAELEALIVAEFAREARREAEANGRARVSNSRPQRATQEV